MPFEIKEIASLRDPQALVEAIQQQFLDLMQQLNSGQEALQLLELHVEPDRPRDGMVVYADGTNWNPGSGEGFYGRQNGAWVKL